jgi:predicted alpha/beta-hydrolase family hydrolase
MAPIPFALPADADGAPSGLLYAAQTPGPLFVFAHGAGAGQLNGFMTRYADALSARGVTVATFNFGYMARGRRVPDRAPVLEATFRAAALVAAAHPVAAQARPLFIGGKSMGGRMATHLASTPAAWPPGAPSLHGVVVFGYPLAPPGGRRSGDRVSHLRAITVPTLIVQGTRDAFGGPDEVRDAVRGNPAIEVMSVDGGDHSFAVLKTSGRDQQDVHTEVCDAVAAWMRR